MKRGFQHGFLGAVVECRTFEGAVLSRVMHPPGQAIDAHHHDWPTLVLCRLGTYLETGDAISASVDGPAVVFQPRGAAHADLVGERGLETLSLTFDPQWLRDADIQLPDRITWRPGGRAALAASEAVRVWTDRRSSEVHATAATSRLLATMSRPDVGLPSPRWTTELKRMIQREVGTRQMAEALSKHPAWLARAYRAWRGEGIADTIRRARIERAVERLRTSDLSIAAVAIDCGFCDQGHMTRVFSRVLGRTPGEVRGEAALLKIL